MFHYTWEERLPSEKHSSLLGPFSRGLGLTWREGQNELEVEGVQLGEKEDLGDKRYKTFYSCNLHILNLFTDVIYECSYKAGVLFSSNLLQPSLTNTLV